MSDKEGEHLILSKVDLSSNPGVSDAAWEMIMKTLFRFSASTLTELSVKSCKLTGSNLTSITNGVIKGIKRYN